jgi:CHAT domain-containing protein/tetratricopeptide (TPR) repeat protein
MPSLGLPLLSILLTLAPETPAVAAPGTASAVQTLASAPDAAALEQRRSEASSLAEQGTKDAVARATAIYREVIAGSRAIGASVLAAQALEELAKLLEDGRERLELLRQALVLREASGDEMAIARNRVRLGQALSETGDKPGALRTLGDALERLHSLGDEQGEAEALNRLGAVTYASADYERALALQQRALVLWEKIGDAFHRAETLGLTAKIHNRQGRPRQALELYEEAQQVFGSMGTADGKLWQSIMLSNIADGYLNLGEAERAEAPLKAAGAIAEAFQAPGHLPPFLILRAKAHTILGETGAALDDLTRARTLFRNAGDSTGEAYALAMLAGIHGHLGDWEQALAHDRDSFSLLQQKGERRSLSHLQYRIGVDLVALERWQEASQTLREALALARDGKDRVLEADVLGYLGDAQQGLGDQDAALASYEQSLTLQREAGGRLGEATALSSLGRLYAALGRKELAADHLARALELWRSTGYPAGEAQALYDLAAFERRQNRLEEARQTATQALAIVESLRGGVSSQTLRASFLASIQDHYALLVDTLLQLHVQDPSRGRAAAAFEIAERARARSLLDTLQERRVDIREGVDPSLLAKEAELREGLNARARVWEGVDAALLAEEGELSRRLKARQAHQANLLERGAEPAQLQAANAEIATLLADYREIQRRIRSASPRYAALVEPQPARLEEIQSGLLDAETALVEYFLGEERSVVWLVTSTTVRAFALPGRSVIEAASRRVSALLRARERVVEFETDRDRSRRIADADRELPAAAAALSELILGPWTASVGSVKRLVIVGDGPLQYLPFAALPLAAGRDAAPLLASHEVVHAPSASVLLELRRDLQARTAAPRTIAVIADPVFGTEDPRLRPRRGPIVARGAAYPRLPDTRIEAQNILKLVDRDQALSALGFAANRATLTSHALEPFRIVHLATHAFVDSARPELSGLVLSLVNERGEAEDGVLRLHDVYNLRLGADLVVLSACRTALGKDVRGEGIIGLTRGFMYAGARRVVASLWSSPDLGTAELMSRFYRNLLKERLAPAAALRAAQLSLFRTERWHAPYYWAGFTVQGDWR